MKKVIVILALLLVINVSIAETLTPKETAINCLNESSKIMKEMEEYNISLIRFNDSLSTATALYEAQINKESRKEKTNYDLIIQYCNDIQNLKNSVEIAIDSYNVFLGFYHETTDDSMDTTIVKQTISEIDEEINGERYENVPKLIDTGYEQISKIKVEQTALQLAYRATSTGIKHFIIKNWIFLLSTLILLLCLYLVYRTKISLWMLKKKLKKITLRRNTLKNLMGDAQRAYFQYGTISESSYRMKIKNFGELVRDIDRQIPLLQKEIASYSYKEAKTELVKENEREKARRGISS